MFIKYYLLSQLTSYKYPSIPITVYGCTFQLPEKLIAYHCPYWFLPHFALNPFYGMSVILFISFTRHSDSMMGRPGEFRMKIVLGSICPSFFVPVSAEEFSQDRCEHSSLPQSMAGEAFVIPPPRHWKTLVFHDPLSADRCLRKLSWLGIVHSIMLSVEQYTQSVEGTHTLFFK